MKMKWSRFGGYECSSRGDKRFSAFVAKLPDGRTIEQHYQCDVKGYDVGGVNWKLGKGKPPLSRMTKDELYSCYLDLWRLWAKDNISLLRELYKLSKSFDYTLSDRFATGDVNQARALADVINELIERRTR